MLFNEPKLLKPRATLPIPIPLWFVSVLFNEPKLLKSEIAYPNSLRVWGFSALQRAEIAETLGIKVRSDFRQVSVLFNEPKLLKGCARCAARGGRSVSVLFNEPKLLKPRSVKRYPARRRCFSALQRAEIAET